VGFGSDNPHAAIVLWVMAVVYLVQNVAGSVAIGQVLGL